MYKPMHNQTRRRRQPAAVVEKRPTAQHPA